MITNSAIIQHATRCVVSSPTPGVLAYRREMIMDVPLIANLSAIQDGRRQMIEENLIKQSKKRIEHHYIVGDIVEQIVWNNGIRQSCPNERMDHSEY